MSILRLSVVIVSLFVTSGVAAALQLPKAAAGLNDVISAVERPFQSAGGGSPELESVQADFFQRSILAAKKREMRADGRMYLKPAAGGEPLKFRFDYYRPAQQEVICDGHYLWVYQPDNRQVIQSDVGEYFDPRMHDPTSDRGVNFLQGLGRISRDFTITFAEQSTDAEGNFILELRPRRSSVMIQRLFITVSRDAVFRGGGRPVVDVPPAYPQQKKIFAILSTTVVDHDGNSTTIEFSNVRENEMISDLLFTFDVPANVKLVRPPSGR